MGREVVEGLQVQSPREAKCYTVETTEWGGSPEVQSVKLIRVRDALDVTADYLDGSYVVSDDNVISPKVQTLVAGELYHLRFLVWVGGHKREPFIEISCED